MALAVGVFFASLTYLLWRTPNILLHVDGTLTRTEATLSKANATLSNLDKGTKAWGDSAQAQAKSVQDLTQDARGTLQEASGTLHSLGVTSEHLQGTLDASTGLLASATKTTDRFPSLIDQFSVELPKVQKATDDADLSFQTFNALLSRPGLQQAIDGAGQTSQSLGKISGDLYVYAHPILNPDPCRNARCKWERAFSKLSAFAGLAANGVNVSHGFTPLPVKLSH
jgi:hypothetical protein